MLSLEEVQIAGRNGMVLHYEVIRSNESGILETYRGREYFLVVGDIAMLIWMEAYQGDYEAISPEFDAIITSFDLLP